MFAILFEPNSVFLPQHNMLLLNLLHISVGNLQIPTFQTRNQQELKLTRKGHVTVSLPLYWLNHHQKWPPHHLPTEGLEARKGLFPGKTELLARFLAFRKSRTIEPDASNSRSDWFTGNLNFNELPIPHSRSSHAKPQALPTQIS